MKRKLALIHNIVWSALALSFLKLAFDHAPPQLWYGLETSALLTASPGATERWFVAALAFAIYSLAFTMTLALVFTWTFFLWRKYIVSMCAAWLPALNLALIAVLFGLPLAPH